MKNELIFAGIDRDSSREAIMRVLIEHFPLPLKTIRSKLKEKQKRSLSLQAVHKSLKSLMKDNVVIHSVLGYQISENWSYKQKQSSDKIFSALEKWEGSQKLIESINNEERISIQFENLASAEAFWIRTFKQVANSEINGKKKNFITIAHVPYWLFINLGASLELHKELIGLGYKLYYHFLTKDHLTKWGADFYKSLGCSSKLLKTNLISQGVYTTIINDCIIQGTLSKQATSDLNKITSKYKHITEIPPSLMFKVFNSGGGMTVSIEKNRNFVQMLKSGLGVKC